MNIPKQSQAWLFGEKLKLREQNPEKEPTRPCDKLSSLNLLLYFLKNWNNKLHRGQMWLESVSILLKDKMMICFIFPKFLLKILIWLHYYWILEQNTILIKIKFTNSSLTLKPSPPKRNFHLNIFGEEKIKQFEIRNKSDELFYVFMKFFFQIDESF